MKETPEQPQEAKRPAVGPNKEFAQKVLHGFQEQPLTEEEIKAKQSDWKNYTTDPFEEKKPRANDFPEYFYAGFWIRLFAFVIDLACISAITNITIGSVYNIAGMERTSAYWSIYGGVSLLIYLSYFIFLTKLNHGQTLGKMIFGIRVISFDEKELSWPTVLVREGACRFILKFPLLLVGYLPVIFSRKKQHIGDFFTNTSVVTINLIKAFNQEVNR